MVNNFVSTRFFVWVLFWLKATNLFKGHTVLKKNLVNLKFKLKIKFQKKEHILLRQNKLWHIEEGTITPFTARKDPVINILINISIKS